MTGFVQMASSRCSNTAWRARLVDGQRFQRFALGDLATDVGLGLDAPTPLGVLRAAFAAQPWPTTGLANPPPRYTWQANLDMRL